MLTVVFSDHDLQGQGHTGSAGNAPEERKRLVQKALRAGPGGEVKFLKVSKPEESIIPLGSLVHDYGLLKFLETSWEKWQEEWEKQPNDHLIGVFCHPVDDNAITSRKPPPPFIPGFFAPKEAYGTQKPTGGVLGQICYYAMDKETPIHESTVPSLKWDLAVTKEACKQLGSKQSRIVYAQITHPGHHAGPTSFGGFCFVNHAGVAAKLLQQANYRRVAVLDVDYHAGNGTMAMFWNDPTVFFASLHGNPEVEYPFNAGFVDQTGGPNAAGTTMNVPLPGGTDWPKYRVELLNVVERIIQFRPDALVISLGVDTLRGDPVALPRSRFCLDPKDYVEMGNILLHDKLLLPTVVIQEGGYKLDDVPLAITGFLTGSLVDRRSFL